MSHDHHGAAHLLDDDVPAVLLLGRPNAGKSSVYNRLTGADARVGNFPGITVDVLCTDLALGSPHGTVRVVDLPGDGKRTGFLEVLQGEARVAPRGAIDGPGRESGAIERHLQRESGRRRGRRGRRGGRLRGGDAGPQAGRGEHEACGASWGADAVEP